LAASGTPFIISVNGPGNCALPASSVTRSSANLRGIAAWARRSTAALIFGAAVTTSVMAVDELSLELERVDGDDWSATGLSASFGLARQQAELQIDRLRMLSHELRDVRVQCPQLTVTTQTIECKRARVALHWRGVGPQVLNADIVYGRSNGALDIVIDGLRLGEGRMNARLALRNRAWSGNASLHRVPIDLLLKLARELRLPVPDLSATGVVTMTASGRGVGDALQKAEVDASFANVTANNESGTLATEKLSLRLQADLRRVGPDAHFSLALQSHAGQAYAQPIFLDLGAHGLALHAQGSLRGNESLQVDRFTIEHAGVAQASGRATIVPGQDQVVRSLQMDIADVRFPAAYDSYLQPLLLATNFKAMKTAGGIAGRVTIEAGAPHSIDLKFDNLSMDDGARNFALEDLQGQWHWRAESSTDARHEREQASASVDDSRLHWRGGALFGMELGASEVTFATAGRQFRLLHPARIPLLDGAIELQSFRMRNVGTPQIAFMVDAEITPVSVSRLCRAFGWPEFGGRIGGVISKLRMREGVLTLGTTLRAQVFDGQVTVSNLRLEESFAQWPRFHSDITLDNLDLELVTSAFSFGSITGRLSGAIDGLQLFNWTPVAFDARLYTPANDRSKHRISQRAVENIGSIGGGGAGVTAALSSGFLRFFDSFNYERLGLHCRLENDVCQMDGVAVAPNGGYYLVKGRGLPRIDVIGSARRVDWPRLVQQLIAVTRSEGPVVK
jgi:hypothetical protein